MEVSIDLHSHSMFAGGSGGLSTATSSIQENMKKPHKRYLEADRNTSLKRLQFFGTA